MSYEESLRSISLNADSTLAGYTGVPNQPGSANPHYGKMYRFVKVTGTGQVGLCEADEDSIGVVQNKPQVTGAAATVGIRGVTNIISGGAITAGAGVKSDADGRGIASAPGDTALAIALAPATAAGQLIPALLRLN